jgi:hypothetical protein
MLDLRFLNARMLGFTDLKYSMDTGLSPIAARDQIWKNRLENQREKHSVKVYAPACGRMVRQKIAPQHQNAKTP